tara:strand:- start:765 stop:1583 length:819 start_codon:yes stop_codon:yes gene_type:complete
MAETMTYDPGTDTVTTENNLTQDEQESLAVGTEMENQQEQALAGKYKNAQELEKAYIELEKKLGEKSEEDSQEESSDEPQAEEKSDTEKKSDDDSPPDFAFLEDLYEQASSEKGEISKELLDKLGGMSTQDVVQQFLNYRADAESRYMPIPQMSETDVKELKGIVGGDKNYSNMLQWAQSNLSEQEINMFDTVMGRGDVASAFFAINSLAQRYNDRVGYDGKMLTGNAPKGSTDSFRSQQELVKAMSDSRYDNDPAYRNDVMEKLARSDMKF